MLFLILALFSGSAVGIENGLALTPPMGWNSYNVYSCYADEAQYQAAAQALVKTGLRDLGYKYLIVDCGWQADARTPSGLPTWNTTRIPSGIPSLSEYVHGLDLLFGLHSNAGYFACDPDGGAEHWIGSLGHESIDAMTYQEWRVDYLKYDNCFAVSSNDFLDYYPPSNLEQGNYERMRKALDNIKSKMIYAICEWGVDDPARWAGAMGNTWRISNDIGPPPSFENLRRIINQFVPVTTFSRPGSWNDLDLLEIGNSGMTQSEWEMHFIFWAAAKQVRWSPLIVSTDLTIAPEAVLNILSKESVIAVNQDSLGIAISFIRRYTDSHDVWMGPLADGSKVVVIVNWMETAQTITIDLSDFTFSSADVKDLWYDVDLGTVYQWTTADVDAHGALIYKLSNAVLAAPRQVTVYLAGESQNVLSGGAAPRTLSDGLSIVIDHIGFGGELTFVDIDGGSSGGTKLVELAYVNADYTFFNTNCSNCRRVQVSVNGGAPVVAEMPLSGQSWDLLFHGYYLSLDGFLPGPVNQVTFANPNAWGPDMYSMNVEV